MDRALASGLGVVGSNPARRTRYLIKGVKHEKSPKFQPKKIVVAGGGVLGSQIAFQAAYVGHDVTIWLSKEITALSPN